MDKINYLNIIKSFFLGLFIGFILQLVFVADQSFNMFVISILVSGSIGFIIGFLTEFITAFLPISLAKPWLYFFINNIIAICITALILMLSILLFDMETIESSSILFMMLTVFFIVCIANLAEYIVFARAQKRLLQKKQSILSDYNHFD